MNSANNKKLQELILRRKQVCYKELYEFDCSYINQLILKQCSSRQLVWHLFHNMATIPLCKGSNCNNQVRFSADNRCYRSFCSAKCSANSSLTVKKRKQTNFKRYGVEHGAQFKGTRDKMAQTCIERYGVSSYSKTKEFQEKTKATNLKNHGVEHTFQINEFKEKRKETMLTRYGVEYALQNKEIQANTKQTNLMKFGVENPFQNELINNKRKNTMIEKYGVEYPIQNKEIKKQIKQTMIENHGVEYPMQNKEIKDKSINTMLFRFGVKYPLQNVKLKEQTKQTMLANYGVPYYKQIHMSKKTLEILNSKEKLTTLLEDNNILTTAKMLIIDPTTVINYINKYNINYIPQPCSYLETEMAAFLTSLDISFETNTRKIIKPLELDFYLPDYNLAIEMNGVYWHSTKFKDKSYHYDKWKMCDDLGIHLVSVFEDDWNLQQYKVMSLIKSLTGRKEKGCFARKCQIRKITAKESRPFLNQYHLQSFVAGKHYGAYNNDMLVGVMTFGLSRNQHFELKRFVTDEFTHAGLFSKIFKFAQTDIGFTEVVSFSDNRWFTGNVYEIAGFDHVSTTGIGYNYLYQGKQVHVSNFTKANIKKKFPMLIEAIDNGMTETQAMELLEIPRVYDCGKKKWLFKV